ncbi:MAG: hypothetical protein AAGJ35_13855, partial [Myxococcota bacterium]
AKHPKWSLRRRIQSALCRNPYTPIDLIFQFLPTLSSSILREMLDPPPKQNPLKQAILDLLNLRQSANPILPQTQQHLHPQQILTALSQLKRTS